MTVKLYKKIELCPYDPAWPKMFEIEAEEIRQFLGTHCLEVHHIGSTSIPGLTAKRDLDILLIVDDLSSSLKLQDHGFVFKGEINIPLRYFFSKNTERSKVNLHVVEPSHGFKNWNLTFRDYLREHAAARDAYGALKLDIIKDASSGERIQNMMPRYTYDKCHFIYEILNEAGYKDTTINFCFHKSEWEAYYRILKQQADAAADLTHFHFVLYCGTTIVAAARVEVAEDHKVIIKNLAEDEAWQGKGFELQLRKIIENWADRKQLVE